MNFLIKRNSIHVQKSTSKLNLVMFLSLFAASYWNQNNFSSDNKCEQIIQGIIYAQISLMLWALPIESKQNCTKKFA